MTTSSVGPPPLLDQRSAQANRVRATSVAPTLPYHRLAHLSPRASRWWRPLLVLVLAAALAAAGLFVVIGADLLVELVDGVPGTSELLDDPRNPADMIMSLGTLAVLVPAVTLAFRWAGGRRRALAGTLHSVAGRFRWGLLGRASLVVLPAYAVINVGSFVLFRPEDFSVPAAGAQLVVVYVAIVLLAPLQCAAEEYVFRALPQQGLGTWLRSPVWGIVLPVPLFVAGHGYDWVGRIDIAVFALAMGYLTWKTGGVELAILVHTANNLTLFLVSPFSPSSLQQGETDPWALAFSLPILLGTTAGLAVWVTRREGVSLAEPVRGSGRRPTLVRDRPARSAAIPKAPGPVVRDRSR